MRTAVLTFLFWFPLHASAHDGYSDLVSPITGGLCCGNVDCGPVETRLGPRGQLQAHIVWHGQFFSHDDWDDVPDEAILPASLNPAAGPSACWAPGRRQIVCFMPGSSD